MIAMQEIWKQIIDHPDYEVSNCGRIKSKKIYNNGKETLHGKKHRQGYLCVHLLSSVSIKTFYIHRLVAAAFIGTCPEGLEVNHKDGDKANNHVDNLEYVTHSKNIKHAYKIGLLKARTGEDNNLAKLTEMEVKLIRELYDTGEYSQKLLAEVFEVNRTTINKIINKKIWSCI